MDTGGEQDVTYSGYSFVVMYMSGVGLMVRVACFGSYGPELKFRSAVELIPGGVNSACHPSGVGKMSASMLVYYVGVALRAINVDAINVDAQPASRTTAPVGHLGSGHAQNQ